MNTILAASEIWLNELGIKTSLFPNCLKVCLADVVASGESIDKFIGALRTGVNSKKIFLSNQDGLWLYLESF